jgi:hypothetical protein
MALSPASDLIFRRAAPALFVFLWSTAGSSRAQSTHALIVSPPSPRMSAVADMRICVEVANRRL